MKVVLLIIAMAISFIISGLVDGFNSSGSGLGPTYGIHTLIFSILLFLWCKEHAKLNNLKLPSNSAILVALLPPIGVPVYFYRAFGIKKCIIGTFLAVILIVFFSLLYKGFWQISRLPIFS